MESTHHRVSLQVLQRSPRGHRPQSSRGPNPAADSGKTRRHDTAHAHADLKRTKEDLNQARDELSSTKSALTKPQAEVKDLRGKYDQVVAQLTDANRKLSSAQQVAQKDDEIIRQLRKENSSLKLMVD